MSDLVEWLRAKYRRHGEIEDKEAADELEKWRKLAADYIEARDKSLLAPADEIADTYRKVLRDVYRKELQKGGTSSE